MIQSRALGNFDSRARGRLWREVYARLCSALLGSARLCSALLGWNFRVLSSSYNRLSLLLSKNEVL